VTLCFNTFSVVARCPRSNELGVAISTALPAVGAYCVYIEPGVGAAATQSWTNPYLALDALAALAEGQAPAAALQEVLRADAEAELRQVGLVDAAGRTQAWTGSGCTEWAGHVLGDGFAVQGNMLVSAQTVEAMAAVMEATAQRDLAQRLVDALIVGQQAGGDKRGKQSAAVKVYGSEPYPLVDLRVDDHPEPVAELARLQELAKVQLQPFLDSLPRRRGPAAVPLSEAAKAMIMLPPQERLKTPGGAG
jgi:uncharacterized Ntn-hydrolase superfamily protein